MNQSSGNVVLNTTKFSAVLLVDVSVAFLLRMQPLFTLYIAVVIVRSPSPLLLKRFIIDWDFLNIFCCCWTIGAAEQYSRLAVK